MHSTTSSSNDGGLCRVIDLYSSLASFVKRSLSGDSRLNWTIGVSKQRANNEVDVLTDPFVVAEGVRVISNTGIMHKRKDFGVKVVGYLVCLLLVVLHHGRMLTNNASIYSGVSSYLISHMSWMDSRRRLRTRH